MEVEESQTPIQNFYAEQSILITGSTGFLGKVLIEKLLRSCPDISTLYLLIRSKNTCPESRLNDMLNIPLYDRVKREVPNFRKKIVLITSNLDTEDFGLAESDKSILISKVSIIFHIAGNVRFTENIKTATTININAVDTILKLAKQMPNLKSLIHVSTAYANCHIDHIEERLYSYPINHKSLIMITRDLSENMIKKKISRIISIWPNSYTFTKAIAEGLIREECEDLQVGIFRPGMVTCSANEPFAGWIDNKYGPIGFLASIMCGFTRFLRCNSDHKANIVPVDFTVNALIASAWDVYKQCRKGKDMLIYNFVSPIDGPTWNEYLLRHVYLTKIYPMRNAIYFPLLFLLKHKISYKICVWFCHFLPALLMDAVYICIGRSPRMWKIYVKIDQYYKVTQLFCNKEWNFSTDNVQAMWDHLDKRDQQLFQFNMMGFNWTKYLTDHYLGIRHYLFKENDSTLKISRLKHKRFYWVHQIIKIIFIFVILWIISIIFT
ncbi:fatty acyl-CoA reductase wat [Solenopsis invicta]|nr:fatty acyl-CoA reductase wat [Solenopsis invicta]